MSSCVLTPANERGLCAPKDGKGRQAQWAVSQCPRTGHALCGLNLSAAVKVGHKFPSDPGFSKCFYE